MDLGISCPCRLTGKKSLSRGEHCPVIIQIYGIEEPEEAALMVAAVITRYSGGGLCSLNWPPEYRRVSVIDLRNDLARKERP